VISFPVQEITACLGQLPAPTLLERSVPVNWATVPVTPAKVARFPPERWPTPYRNGGPLPTGISGPLAPEYAATPCERLLAREDVSDECKEQLRRTLASLDPVRLLSEIREAQRTLAQLEAGVANAGAAQTNRELSGFVASLS